MKLDNLTTEEIKEIMKQLLYKVEADKEVVEKDLKFRRIYKYKNKYCVNFYNGYEYKICSIDDYTADISSESLRDNLEITKYYKILLENIYAKKESEQLVIV